MRKYKSFIILGAILISFILGFYVLSGLYQLSNKSTKTVVLGKENFPTGVNDFGKEIQVQNVDKYELSGSIMNLSVLDNDSLIFTQYDSNIKNKGAELCILKLSTKNKNTIATGDILSAAAYKDGKKIIYNQYQPNGSIKANIYDVQANKVTKTVDCAENEVEFLDSNKFINLSFNQMCIKNIDTGENTYLSKIKTEGNSEFTIGKLSSFTKISNVIVSPDETKIYFLGSNYQRSYDTTVGVINTTKENDIEYLIKGNIMEFAPLSNGNLVVSGYVNGESGISLYNVKNNSYNVLVNEKAQDFCMTSNGKIAYTVKDSKGVTEVHVALIKNDKLYFDKVIYSNLKYLVDLKWSQDGNSFFCINTLSNGSVAIYKFTF